MPSEHAPRQIDRLSPSPGRRGSGPFRVGICGSLRRTIPDTPLSSLYLGCQVPVDTGVIGLTRELPTAPTR
jgi:hypothetical protein